MANGSVVAITGAARGIGRAVALAAAAEGDNLVLCDLDGAGLGATSEEARALGSEVALVEGNAAERTTAVKIVESAIAGFGRIDGLVCAGMQRRHAPAEQVTDGDWDQTIAQGLTGCFRCAQEAGRVMIRQGGGSIVFITSTGGRMAVPGVAAYAAAKAGAAGLARQLGVEWADRGISVNAVAPGVTVSDERPPPMRQEAIAALIPTSRPVAAPEIAALCLFLLRPAARQITGQEIVMDGGLTVGRGFGLYKTLA